jgi:DNA-binding transcriptional MerR regulator
MMIGTTIGKLAKKTGFTVAAIRFYEAKGLMPKAGRSANGRRQYGAEDLANLEFIAKCRQADIGLGAIKELLVLKDGAATPCADAHRIVEARISDVRRKIAEMKVFVANLETLAAKCSPSCCGSAAEDCTIFN